MIAPFQCWNQIRVGVVIIYICSDKKCKRKNLTTIPNRVPISP
jgi:hypothetical protein